MLSTVGTPARTQPTPQQSAGPSAGKRSRSVSTKQTKPSATPDAPHPVDRGDGGDQDAASEVSDVPSFGDDGPMTSPPPPVGAHRSESRVTAAASSSQRGHGKRTDMSQPAAAAAAAVAAEGFPAGLPPPLPVGDDNGDDDTRDADAPARLQNVVKVAWSKPFQLLPPEDDPAFSATMQGWRRSMPQCVTLANGKVLTSHRIERHTVVAIEGNRVFGLLCEEAMDRCAGQRSPAWAQAVERIVPETDAELRYRVLATGPEGSFQMPDKVDGREDVEATFLREEARCFEARVAAMRAAWTVAADAQTARENKAPTTGQALPPEPNCAVMSVHAGPPHAVETVRVVVALSVVRAKTRLVADPLSVVEALDPETGYAIRAPRDAVDRLNLVPATARLHFHNNTVPPQPGSGASADDVYRPPRSAAAAVDGAEEDEVDEEEEELVKPADDACYAYVICNAPVRQRVPFFVQALFGRVRVPVRPRRTCRSSSEALVKHWPWGSGPGRSAYYYGLGEAVRVAPPPTATATGGTSTGHAASSVATNGGVFEGLYFPDSLLLLRPELRIGRGQNGVEALEAVPYGTCFAYAGRLVQYAEGDTLRPPPPPGSATTKKATGSGGGATNKQKRDAEARRNALIRNGLATGTAVNAGYFSSDDRTYEFGLGADLSVLGGGISRCINHRFNLATFGNLQFMPLLLPTIHGDDVTAAAYAAEERKGRKKAGASKGRRGAAAAATKTSSEPSTLASSVAMPDDACSCVPVFMCISDIPRSERVIAASYGEGYDALLERQACIGGMVLTGEEAFAMKRVQPMPPALDSFEAAAQRSVKADLSIHRNILAAPSSIIDRVLSQRAAESLSSLPTVSPAYAGDYRFAIERGSIVFARRWLTGVAQAEEDRWGLLERTVPKLRQAAFNPCPDVPCLMYLFVVRALSTPRASRASQSFLSEGHGGIVAAPVRDWLLLLEPLPVVDTSPAAKDGEDAREAALAFMDEVVPAGATPSPLDTVHRTPAVGGRPRECVVCGATGVALLDDLEFEVDGERNLMWVGGAFHAAAAAGARALRDAVLRASGGAVGAPVAASFGTGHGDPSQSDESAVNLFQSSSSVGPGEVIAAVEPRFAMRSGAVWQSLVGTLPPTASDFRPRDAATRARAGGADRSSDPVSPAQPKV